MAVYKQASPDGSIRWMVDFIWVDRLTGKKRRIRRAAKDRKGRPAASQTAAERAEYEMRTALATGTYDPDVQATQETQPWPSTSRRCTCPTPACG